MKILQVKKLPIFDIFLSEGWTHWTRVLLKKDHLIHLAGDRLNGMMIRDALRTLTTSTENSKKNISPSS